MTSDVTAITPHQGLMIREPFRAGLFLVSSGSLWASPSGGLPFWRDRGTVFKLLLSARRKWRRLDGSIHLAEVIQGVMFKDGIKQIQSAAYYDPSPNTQATARATPGTNPWRSSNASP